MRLSAATLMGSRDLSACAGEPDPSHDDMTAIIKAEGVRSDQTRTDSIPRRTRAGAASGPIIRSPHLPGAASVWQRAQRQWTHRVDRRVRHYAQGQSRESDRCLTADFGRPRHRIPTST